MMGLPCWTASSVLKKQLPDPTRRSQKKAPPWALSFLGFRVEGPFGALRVLGV